MVEPWNVVRALTSPRTIPVFQYSIVAFLLIPGFVPSPSRGWNRPVLLSEVEFDDVFVVEGVGEVDVLAVVDAGAPAAGGLELFR